MGAWGHGNLESDGALDVRGEISDELFGRVIHLLNDPRAAEYDEAGHYELFVRIEMIIALHAGGLISTSIQQAELGVLFEAYLRRWEDYSGENPPSERRQIIEDTFARLQGVVRELHDHATHFVEVEVDPTDERHRMVLDIFDRAEKRGRSNPGDAD
jgi:hypothetical protein